MKKVILFGASQTGLNVMEKIMDRYDGNICFCDNDINKVGTTLNGINIISFEDLVQLFKNNKLKKIVITSSSIDKIIYQISNANIDNNIIQFYDDKYDMLRPIYEKYQDIVYSQDGEEIYLKNRFAQKKTGTYVDVGANHPFRYSNTYWAYEKGWRGITIEPDIINYKLLMNFREEDININCGVSDKETNLEYFIFKESALNTFCKEEIKNKADIISTCIIPVRRLDSILQEYNINHIDFIDIDVEGMEMSVLNSINWNKVSIDCILVEQKDMVLTDIISSKVYSFLLNKGYLPVNKYNRTTIYEKIINSK